MYVFLGNSMQHIRPCCCGCDTRLAAKQVREGVVQHRAIETTHCCFFFNLQVAASKGSYISYALDTKGPEIRTAMLKEGKDIMLNEGKLYTVWVSARISSPLQHGDGVSTC